MVAEALADSPTGDDRLASWKAVLPTLRRKSRQKSCPQLLGLQHSPQPPPRQAPIPQLLVEVQAEGSRVQIHMTAADSLRDLRARVCSLTGIPVHRQVIVLCEERARSGSIGLIAKRLKRQWSARPDLRSQIMRHLNFVFLPEVFNRELSGRGWIGWAKSTQAWRSLQEAQNQAAARGAAGAALVGAAVQIQVERLSGQTVTLEVAAGEPLSQLQLVVEMRLGILAQQQRFLVVEQPSPGIVGLVSSTVLLHGLSGAKAAVGLGMWLGWGLMGKLRGSVDFPLTVRRENGSCTTVTVTGDTTLAQIQGMLAARDLQDRALLPVAAPTRPLGPMPGLEEIAFPASKPPRPDPSPSQFLQVCSGLSWKLPRW